MDTGRRLDPKPSSGVQLLLSKESEEAGRRSIGYFDPVPDDGIAISVCNGD
jgi:hypothetical protein